MSEMLTYWVESIIYLILIVALAIYVIPMILFLWGSMFAKGIFEAYYKMKIKHKYNGKEKQEE